MQIWTASSFFSWIYCRRFSKNRFSQILSTFTKTFHPFARTTKSELSFMMLTGLPPRAVESNSGYTRSPMGRPAKVLFACRTFLFNGQCHLREVITTLITWRTASGVCLQVSFSLSWRPCDLGVAPEKFSWVFGENLSRKQGFSEIFCFRIRCSLLNTQLSTFRNSLLWDRICW